MRINLSIGLSEEKTRALAQLVNAKVNVPGVPEVVETVVVDRVVNAAFALAQEELPKLAETLTEMIGAYVEDVKVTVTP